METNEKYAGVAEDPRAEEKKTLDWRHEELFAMGAYPWREKPQNEWKSYPIRNQDGSGMCGPFSTCKALGINNKNETGEYVNLNTAYIYARRGNKPGAGMWMQDMFEIARTFGAPLDPALSSDGINDAQADAIAFDASAHQEALKYRGLNYAFADVNMDTIAGLVDQGFTPILLLRCSFKEYTAEPIVIPTVTSADYDVNHYVPVVDATLYKGKKCLVIEDSWGQQFGHQGRRIFSEDFVKARVFNVGYIIDRRNEQPSDVTPRYRFLKPLRFGMRNDKDVKALQDVLKAEGLFPNSVQSTGNFLQVTLSAVKKLQAKYAAEILAPLGLTVPTGFVGSSTRAWLNKKYGA